MSKPSVSLARVAVFGAVPKLLDYRIPAEIEAPIGARVVVPLGSKEVLGLVVAHPEKPYSADIQLKDMIEALDSAALIKPDMLRLLTFASAYYHHPIGQSISASLPPQLRKGQMILDDKVGEPVTHPYNTPESAWPLCPEQQHAVDTIRQSQGTFQTHLLMGITGSGKTEVYLQLIDALAPVLVLIPEIGLAPQTVERFKKRFPSKRIACLHSKTPPKQRLALWQQACHGKLDVLIGTRMALWSPMPHLGLIVVDEEHDMSFKQQEGMRYSARDLAVIRGQVASCPVVLGSATPSLESLRNVRDQKYQLITLTARAGSSTPPTFEVVDLRKQPLVGGMTPHVWDALRHTLNQGEQAIVFINRRGFSPVLLCHTCGDKIPCPACDAMMVFHEQHGVLRCPHCNRQKPKQPCKSCGADTWIPVGYGTERLEQVLKEELKARIIRMDRDSVQRTCDLETLLSTFTSHQADVLIGTQMIAKGHHFPHVSLVAILDVDHGLYSVDFRALERMGQLITQVAGRAGREHAQGRVILQTHEPQHPMLQCLIQRGYPSFAEVLLDEREQAGLPPYRHAILVQATSKDPKAPFQFLHTAQQRLRIMPGMDCWGPMKAPLPRKDHTYRANLYLQTTHRAQRTHLIQALSSLLPHIRVGKSVTYRIEVDPMDFNG